MLVAATIAALWGRDKHFGPGQELGQAALGWCLQRNILFVSDVIPNNPNGSSLTNSRRFHALTYHCLHLLHAYACCAYISEQLAMFAFGILDI